LKKCLSVFCLILLCFAIRPSPAQEPYKLPPKEVIDILDAPPTPRVILSPSGNLMLLADYEPMPSISYLAQPILRLAGLRITPKNNSRQQMIFYTVLTLKNIKSGATQRIALPQGIKFGAPQWSPDDRWLAFSRNTESGIELWVVDARSGQAKALTSASLNCVLNGGYTWMPESQHLLVSTVLENRGTPPQPPSVPVGPNIQETSGKFVKVWTYQDLLKNPYDEALFEYYATSQLVEIDALSGQVQKVGPPGVYLFAFPSPDGAYFLVHKIKRPYSYSVPCYDFAHSVEIWSRAGEPVRTLADLPPAEEVPLNGVATGVREVEWEPLKPATLIWAEALDGGDPEKEVPHRDKLMMLSGPFKEDGREVIKIQHRYSGIFWLAAQGEALTYENDWKKRWDTTYWINVDNPELAPKKIFDLSSNDEYRNPGFPVMATTLRGERVVLKDKDWIYLSGSGATPQGERPFLDKLNLKTMQKERLFRSGETSYELFYDFVGNSRDQILARMESKNQPPNFFLLNLKSKKKQSLTDFKDPAPQMTGIKKQLIKYKREDGVELSGTLYLPPGYKEGERLPVVIWAYPLEYSDPATAGQVRGSPNTFTFYRGISELFFLTQGYAVLDDAQMPVVGDPKTMNDTFVQQIVSNAKAAIDALDALGVGDRRRVGVGGHSYGAFMTANLLAHCDLFAAGIARSGAYNRTLTPFGFQSERRTLWEVPEIYVKLSPYMFANKIQTPILLIHGEADNNSGTFPIQSERLFSALKGFGATARLVMLPLESHGYMARESILHVLAEMFEWLDKYVKNRK
jgi:dipeptidyl aminopeptidase/acylaminoacyl peptidase